MLSFLSAQCLIIIIIIICVNIVIITTNLSTATTCFGLCISSLGYSKHKEVIFYLFLYF